MSQDQGLIEDPLCEAWLHSTRLPHTRSSTLSHDVSTSPALAPAWRSQNDLSTIVWSRLSGAFPPFSPSFTNQLVAWLIRRI
jgi:hypothetical protein